MSLPLFPLSTLYANIIIITTTTTTSGDKLLKCTYDYDQQDSNFQEVCTSDAVQGQVVDTLFEMYCIYTDTLGNVTYTFLQAPMCLSTNCETAVYGDALTVITDAMASYLNTLPGIQDCTGEKSGGTSTSHDGMIRATFISSAVFVAMMTVLF